MTKGALHPLAEDYLRRLRRAGRGLPPERLRDLVSEIEGHLSEAIPPDASDHEALEVLERVGPPGEIVEAEQPAAQPAADRRGLVEWAAMILLPLGGFAFGIGWLVGLILLWSSRVWTTRDKLIGTLIIPGGLATGVLVFLWLNAAAARSGGGLSTAMTVVYIALAVVLFLGPIVSAVYLAHRARNGAPSVATATL